MCRGMTLKQVEQEVCGSLLSLIVWECCMCLPACLHTCLFFVSLCYAFFHSQTKTKIIIRGKGSVKAGKVETAVCNSVGQVIDCILMFVLQIGIKPGQPMPGEDEPLHALVTASNQDDLQSGIRKVHTVHYDSGF